MTLDPTFVERNRASTARIRDLAARLSDDQMRHPVGEHWTVSVALAHLAFWDSRVLAVLDQSEAAGKPVAIEFNMTLNDLLTPFFAAIPPREAARLAIENAETLDKRLEAYPRGLLEQINDYNQRWVLRALHRNEHLDEVDAALKH